MNPNISKTGVWTGGLWEGFSITQLQKNNLIINSNLVPNQGQYNSKDSAFIWTSNQTDGCKWIPNSAFEIKPSTTYTISLHSDGTLSSTHGRGGLSVTEKPFSFWLYLCNSNTSQNWASGGYDTPILFTSNNYNHQQIGKDWHIWQFTTSSTQKYMSLRVNNYSDGSTNLTIKYWGFKIEEGNKNTPWIPNINDSIYTTYNFTNNKILNMPIKANQFYEF